MKLRKIVRSYGGQKCEHGIPRAKCDTCIAEIETRISDNDKKFQDESVLFVDKRLKQVSSLNDKSISRTKKKSCHTPDDVRERELYQIMKHSLCSCKHRPQSRDKWLYYPEGRGHTSTTYRCPHCRKIVMFVNTPLPIS